MADQEVSASHVKATPVSVLTNQHEDGISQKSQTASDYIDSQLQLEADAREALPYNFDHCTQPLGALRQSLFACLTCNPPPSSETDAFTPAAVCYSCSIACHGEHTLVELFNRRNFVCDCGTTRLPSTSPCTLRIDPQTGMKGPVHSQVPAAGNNYNKNFRNRFCACGEWYDPHQEKGTMFQCLGLATEAEGGCGEDWWHPECVLGLGRDTDKQQHSSGDKDKEEGRAQEGNSDQDAEHPTPPGFPHEDDFEAFICYKCVGAHPWIKSYAGTAGFLAPVHNNAQGKVETEAPKIDKEEQHVVEAPIADSATPSSSKKRSADDAELDVDSSETKKARADDTQVPDPAYHASLPPPPLGAFSLFLRDDFREHFCRCRECYPTLAQHPQLLEEEETYEPPLSDSEDEGAGGSKATGSLLDRGEAALSNVDRVRAIEGVMVYNHLRDKVKAFLQPFAESGQAVGAEDIKAYFEKLRGDEQGIREAGAASAKEDHRKEQSGRSPQHVSSAGVYVLIHSIGY